MPFGVDPKTVVCIFYKQGNCEKGKKCKFSHDLSVERKGEKKNLYQDTREGEDEAKKKDDMAEWDEGESERLHMLQELLPGTIANAVPIQRNYGKSSCRNTATQKPPPTKSANTSSPPSKKASTAGSGPVPTAATNACTSTPSHRASS